MLSSPYYAKNYAGIINSGLTPMQRDDPAYCKKWPVVFR